MSDEPTTFQNIVSVASAVTPVAGDVGEVAKLGDDIVNLITPPIKQAEIDKPTNELRQRLASYETIVNNPNEAVRGQQLAAFCDQLLNDADVPIGLLSGRTVRVPVEHFTAFIDAVGQLIELREQEAAVSKSTSVTK